MPYAFCCTQVSSRQHGFAPKIISYTFGFASMYASLMPFDYPCSNHTPLSCTSADLVMCIHIQGGG